MSDSNTGWKCTQCNTAWYPSYALGPDPFIEAAFNCPLCDCEGTALWGHT